MALRDIPQDINAEVLLDYLDEDVRVQFGGLHKRNAYKDVLGLETGQGKMLLTLGRNSIYHSLPEYIFHAIDRFDNIPQSGGKELFAEEYSRQEKEKEEAHRFFAPIDILLLQLRLDVRRVLEKYSSENIILQDILTDSLGEETRRNRFVKRTLPYLVSCKSIRGDRTQLTLMLRKVLFDEGIRINVKRNLTAFSDAKPRYEDSIGGVLGEVYAGNHYEEAALSFSVYYWSEEDCDKDFLRFVEEVEVYRQFVQDYFLSVECILLFDVSHDAPSLRLSDETVYNYLSYNTNL